MEIARARPIDETLDIEASDGSLDDFPSRASMPVFLMVFAITSAWRGPGWSTRPSSIVARLNGDDVVMRVDGVWDSTSTH